MSQDPQNLITDPDPDPKPEEDGFDFDLSSPNRFGTLRSFRQGLGFAEYLEFLKEYMDDLLDYRSKTGILSASESSLSHLRLALHHEDPFVVFNASLIVGGLLMDKTIYH